MTIKILYLEDEPDMVDYLPLLLGRNDIEVMATGSIKEALTLLESEKFDGVLLDIMMPPTEEMDLLELDYGRKTGIEVARRIKAIQPEIPIVAFTALFDEEILAEMGSAGIIKIIHRPAEVSDIIHALREVTGIGD